MANDIITNLHPDNDPNTNLYPNIKKENIPNKSISTDKLDDNVLSLIGSLKPSGTDTSTNILAFTSNKGIYVATDNGHWYYWNGAKYVDSGMLYQSSEDIKQLKKNLTNEITARQNAISAEANRAMARENEIEALFTLPTEEAVNKWLDDHPEATTTVQDGSLTESKFSNALKLKVIKDYITPQMFGAVGDGVTDDTEALRESIRYSNDNGAILLFPYNHKYFVTDSINYYDGAYHDVVLNIIGSSPNMKGGYSLDQFGGIRMGANTSLFNNATIKGSIKNLCIVGIRQSAVKFFNNCNLSAFYMSGCNVANIEAFLCDSGMNQVSRIDCNKFLSVEYFHKYVEVARGITDSYIVGNYINGGAEATDNACFEFQDGNGSTVQGNFIDYYKSIYRPKPAGNVQFPLSIGNQYQVFLYLYDVTYIPNNSFHFCSIGDSFNWNDESKLDKLKTYVKNTYIGKDGMTYDIPPYIYMIRHSSTVKIKNAYIQRNISNIVFVFDHLGEYIIANFEASFLGVNRNRAGSVQLRSGDSKPYYNAGNYIYNTFEPYFIVTVDELPSINTGWCVYPNGFRVRCNNQNYRMINKYNQSEHKWEAKWIETDDI